MEHCTLKYTKLIPKNVMAELQQTYTISSDQLDFYCQNGFLVIKELIDFASLYTYKKRFIDIAKGVVSPGRITVMREPVLKERGLKGEDVINKVQDILFDDIFSQYTENPRLLHVLSQLIGPDIRAMHSMFINKPPGTGRHPPHQDLYYFPFRPADKIIASWTAVDRVTVDNGCLYVLPGSHRRGVLYKHGNLQDSNKLYHGILEEATAAPADQRVNLEMSPGDTVFFHPMLVHGSGPNVTKNYRKSISCHYASTSCEYVDVRGTLQEEIAREVEGEARRRGFDIDFIDVWRYRSKHIQGQQSKL